MITLAPNALIESVLSEEKASDVMIAAGMPIPKYGLLYKTIETSEREEDTDHRSSHHLIIHCPISHQQIMFLPTTSISNSVAGAGSHGAFSFKRYWKHNELWGRSMPISGSNSKAQTLLFDPFWRLDLPEILV